LYFVDQGSQVSQIAFPLLMLNLTGSPAQAGLLGTVGSLPYLILSLPAGALIDRWDRKQVMILCDTGRALALGSIPVALWLTHLTAAQLYIVALSHGILFVFFSLAGVAALPRVVPKHQLPTAMAQNQIAGYAAGLLGPSLGGYLYRLGRALPFLSDALSYVASVIGLLVVKTAFQEQRTQPRDTLGGQILAGLLWLWRQPLVRIATFRISSRPSSAEASHLQTDSDRPGLGANAPLSTLCPRPQSHRVRDDLCRQDCRHRRL
jgi:MFS family permease